MPNPPDKTTRPLGRVLLTGATGMVGSSVLRVLLNEKTVREVVSLGRRLSGIDHPKLTDVRFEAFGETQSIEPYLNGINTVFHCLATYSARVSRAEYEEITVDWMRALLAACERSAPGVTFCLFSAQGARSDGGGMSFALKIKGEAESKLFASDLERKFAFRPGYIAPSGPRSTWKMADHLFKPLQRLMPSIGVTSDELAHAMLYTAIHDRRCTAVLENGEMRTLFA
ncbi:NAD-dependent epimerase/dehydratase family protein [Ruegeria arenilitoris]|uniref:NAD-dependent epimerase/dehydratase family protein n=1 Tax=Ruegeria arenilitoris TaxID=1173585 RepID=UPI00147B40E1